MQILKPVVIDKTTQFNGNFRLDVYTLKCLCLASHKSDIGKQCRSTSDTTECGV